MKRALCFILIFIIVITSKTGIADASGAIGSKNSSSGTGGPVDGVIESRGPLKWYVRRDLPANTTIYGSILKTKDTFVVGKDDSVAYMSMRTYRRNGKDILFPDNWFRWSTWLRVGHPHPSGWSASQLNNMMDRRSYFPNDFRNVVKQGYPSVIAPGAIYMNRRSGDIADLIWIDGTVYEKETREEVKTIVKYSNSGKPSSNFDNSSKSNKWHFNNPKRSINYSYNSPRGTKDYDHDIKATTMTVTKVTKWKENKSGVKKDITVTYTSKNKKTKSVKAKWKADIVKTDYKMFKPLDLRTGKTVSDSILISNGYSLDRFRNKSIEARLDNGKIESEKDTETPTEILDVNTPKKFKVEFDNNQFGIPSESSGGIKVTKNKPNLHNMLGQQAHYSPKIYMSSSNSVLNPSRTSLELDGVEVVGDKAIIRNYGFKGGDFFYRTISPNDEVFYLGNGMNNNSFWTVVMEVGIGYMYGSKYSGKITPGNSGPVYTNTRNGRVNITETNAHKGEVKETVHQPILYGEFTPKSVSGTTK